MAIACFSSTADRHTNALRAHVATVARAVAVLQAIALTRAMMIAANYGLSAHRLGVNHV
jgi:hypothetical protein